MVEWSEASAQATTVSSTWGIVLAAGQFLAAFVLALATLSFQRWAKRQRRPSPVVADVAVYYYKNREDPEDPLTGVLICSVTLANPGEVPLTVWKCFVDCAQSEVFTAELLGSQQPVCILPTRTVEFTYKLNKDCLNISPLESDGIWNTLRFVGYFFRDGRTWEFEVPELVRVGLRADDLVSSQVTDARVIARTSRAQPSRRHVPPPFQSSSDSPAVDDLL